MLRRCALLAGLSLVTASPRHDPAFFDGLWDARIMGDGVQHTGDPPPTCRAGLCAGAGTRYPTGPGIVFESEYNIPELPSAFGPKTGLTDYLCDDRNPCPTPHGARAARSISALSPSPLPACPECPAWLPCQLTASY